MKTKIILIIIILISFMDNQGCMIVYQDIGMKGKSVPLGLVTDVAIAYELSHDRKDTHRENSGRMLKTGTIIILLDGAMYMSGVVSF